MNYILCENTFRNSVSRQSTVILIYIPLSTFLRGLVMKPSLSSPISVHHFASSYGDGDISRCAMAIFHVALLPLLPLWWSAFLHVALCLLGIVCCRYTVKTISTASDLSAVFRLLHNPSFVCDPGIPLLQLFLFGANNMSH